LSLHTRPTEPGPDNSDAFRRRSREPHASMRLTIDASVYPPSSQVMFITFSPVGSFLRVLRSFAANFGGKG
jgi:hypothetical protein